MTKPLKNVQVFIHMIFLCINSIFQTAALLVIVFHLYAVAGMYFFNKEYNVYFTRTTKYETSSLC